ncbi:unnamed protein product, partial [Iphiclides podalirius]
MYSAEKICHGCLSSDRNIEPLGELADLFYILTRIPASEIFLCWECRNVLWKTWRFQRRLHHAQCLLQQATLQMKSTQTLSLSTLSTVFNEKYETVHESVEDDTKQTQLKLEPETSDRDEVGDVKEEVNDVNHSDFEDQAEDPYKVEETNVEIDTTIEKTNLENDTKEVQVNNPSDIKQKGKEVKEMDRRQCKYIKYAIVTRNDFNTAIDNYCIKGFLTEELIEELLDRRLSQRRKKNPRFGCKPCDARFHKVIDWRRHNILKHPTPEGPYRCCECERGPAHQTLADLRAHWCTHETYKCKMCGDPFKSQGEFQDHIRLVHAFMYSCVDCGCNFHSYRDFVRHYKELHEKMTCDYCGNTYTRKKSLETHIKRAHLPPVCRVCGRSYKTAHALESHGRLRHPELYYDVTKTELSYCVECNKQFNSVYTYKRHLSTAFIHRPPKPVRIPCPDCGKVFSRKLYMNNHYRLFHTTKTRHYCEPCNKYYVTAYALRNHKQRIHEKTLPPKNKICDICGRGFSTNRVLINHRRTHTGERPFKCSQCPAAFAQKYAKKSHERSQHKIF